METFSLPFTEQIANIFVCASVALDCMTTMNTLFPRMVAVTRKEWKNSAGAISDSHIAKTRGKFESSVSDWEIAVTEWPKRPNNPDLSLKIELRQSETGKRESSTHGMGSSEVRGGDEPGVLQVA